MSDTWYLSSDWWAARAYSVKCGEKETVPEWLDRVHRNLQLMMIDAGVAEQTEWLPTFPVVSGTPR